MSLVITTTSINFAFSLFASDFCSQKSKLTYVSPFAVIESDLNSNGISISVAFPLTMSR